MFKLIIIYHDDCVEVCVYACVCVCVNRICPFRLAFDAVENKLCFVCMIRSIMNIRFMCHTQARHGTSK